MIVSHIALVFGAPLLLGQVGPRNPIKMHPEIEYLQAIRRTAEMVNDAEAQRMARERDLNILNLTWEDTGRYKNSSVGPNISDMTIQVSAKDQRGQFQVRCMPVIRFPNFSDTTADLDPRDFTLLVGNQSGRGLKRISLYEFLEHPTDFLSNSRSWRGSNRTLLADRDDKVLVSAQSCFLPIPELGKATFNPVLFNYQSVSGDPAVLTILATREGTSVTVIDNKRDAFSEGGAWGQRLFHNQGGMRASLTGTRESDFNRGGLGKIGPGEPDDLSGKPAAKPRKAANLNMVLLIQVPLRQKHPMRTKSVMADDIGLAPMAGAKMERRSDVENAVIGHGDLEGPFTEIDNLAIVRDERFPIRVTVQFYKATSNGIVSAKNLDEVKASIDKIYARGDAVGSLVTQGDTGRATEYVGLKVQPRDWWLRFWQRHEENTGETRGEAWRNLRKLLGKDPYRCSVTELYLHDLLRA